VSTRLPSAIPQRLRAPQYAVPYRLRQLRDRRDGYNVDLDRLLMLSMAAGNSLHPELSG
jgi:hypothetical protein